MKRMSSAQFRRTYAREGKPVEVTAYGAVIGTWYPIGSEATAAVEVAAEPEAETEETPARFTIRPVKGPRVVMSGKTQRVLDPLDMRQAERSRADEFLSRTWSRRKA